MRLIFALAILSAVLYQTEGFLGYPPERDTGVLGSMFTSFTQTDKLGVPTDLNYAFILVRHGMVVPVDKSYPSDSHFKRKWKKERFTTHGKRMMTKLGRSLATRYKSFIDTHSLNKVYASTMDTLYGYTNAVELLAGMGKNTPLIERRADIDKFQLLKSPKDCVAYAGLKTDVERYELHDDDETFLFYYLRRSIGETKNKDSMWYINSNERVYYLWEIIDFERKSKKWEPLWYGEDTRQSMRRIVNRYLHDSILGRVEMAQYVVGPLFQEMLDDYHTLNTKLRIHVTNDFTYAAFKSILLERGITAPEFGETLMVEVDIYGYTKVYTYKPYRYWGNYHRHLFKFMEPTRKLSDIRELLRMDYRFGENIHEDEWKRRCNGIMPYIKPRPYKVLVALTRSPRTHLDLESPSRRSEGDDYRSGGRGYSWETPQRDSTVGKQSNPSDSESQLTSRRSGRRLSSPSDGRGAYEEPVLADSPIHRPDTPVSFDHPTVSSRPGHGLDYPNYHRVEYWDPEEYDVPMDSSRPELPRSFSGTRDSPVAPSVKTRLTPASPPKAQPSSIHSETFRDLAATGQSPPRYLTDRHGTVPRI